MAGFTENVETFMHALLIQHIFKHFHCPYKPVVQCCQVSFACVIRLQTFGNTAGNVMFTLPH
jgi:rhamnose utilization protein RhaD (predicted bifunctional aldolase and dehydrogenase)